MSSAEIEFGGHMSEAINIQWFPGHMKKTQRMIVENVKMVDCVCEIIDSRIPYSSRNPDIDTLVGNKPRLIVMNRVDQADAAATEKWRKYFLEKNIHIIETDSKTGSGTAAFTKAVRNLLKDKIERLGEKGQEGKALRIMIVGVPNVGKSSFINKIAKRKAAAASDRPGVTRGKQWVTIDKGLEMLDTPGILWPRFESQIVGENLAFTGAVRDAVVDVETLASNLMYRLASSYPQMIVQRYKFEPSTEMTGFELLETAAVKRGFKISGGEADTERMANILLDEFRGGKLGRITLELPEDSDE